MTSEAQTIDDLRNVNTNKLVVGAVVFVHGYHSPFDNGGGYFKLVEINDYVSNTNYSAGSAPVPLLGANIIKNYPYAIERNQPLYGNIPDQIKWTGGAVWTKNAIGHSPGDREGWASFKVWIGDSSLGVAAGEKGYVIPRVEGWRVVPHSSQTLIWERQIENGTVTPEMFGAKKSDRFGVVGSGNDCASAFQACFDSPFNVEINPGNWYLGSKLYLKLSKTIKGVGNSAWNPDRWRDPSQIADQYISRIWTDQNIDFIDVQRACHFEGIQFNAEHTIEGEYDKTILNYNMSFPNWGSSVWFCSFRGNPKTASKYPGKGGTAIRFNSDDADNTLSQMANQSHTHGSVACWSSRKISVWDMAIGHKIDQIKAGQASQHTGQSINTWTNCTELDGNFVGVKQPIRWLAGSVNRISGEYMQDAPCLPYAERNMPMVYMRNVGETSIDLGIGDTRQTLPQNNDDVLLGGSVTYPQPHYRGYLYDVDSLSFTGRSIRDYRWGNVANTDLPYVVTNQPHSPLDNAKGHLFWSRAIDGTTEATSWIDNGFLFADKKATVTVNALRASSGFDFATELDSQDGILSPAVGVAMANMQDLWTAIGVQVPTISFGAGSDANLDFIEITLKNQIASEDFIKRCQKIFVELSIGCKSIQVITRSASAALSNVLIDTSGFSGKVKRFAIPVKVDNSTVKIILRFIGSTGTATAINSLHMNTVRKVSYPFLPAHVLKPIAAGTPTTIQELTDKLKQSGILF
jgi:hypothetical protein